MTPLVLIPGMMCDARLFGPQIDAFSGHRHLHLATISGRESIEALAVDVLAQAPPRFALADFLRRPPGAGFRGEAGDKVIVEEAVDAREIEVAVLDGPRVSVPGEILIEAEWYTYEAKYEDAASRFDTPARLTPAQTAHVQQLAARAFEALELRGPTRVDFFFEEWGRGFLINEVNTMPGFTPGSGFPLMWQASGMSYPALCDELVKLALG